jgi:murein L,D-transpeptidase YcbB/YkuD
MVYRNLKFIILVIIAGISLSSCGRYVKKTTLADSLVKDWGKTIKGNFTKQSGLVFDSSEIVKFYDKYPDIKAYEAQIRVFYRKRNYSYAWFNNGSLIEQAGNLSTRMTDLQTDGVYKQVPYQNALDSLIDEVNAKPDQTKPSVALELMLTSQYFVFSKLAFEGMDTSVSNASSWYVPRKSIDYNQYLDSLLKTPAKQLVADEPVYRQYELLRTYLRKYKTLDSAVNWQPILISKKPPAPGDSNLVITYIKHRLYKLEDYKGDTTNRFYDKDLVTAVKQFQARTGLAPTGLINRQTMAALNVPLKARIKQILVNMERSRWLPVSLNKSYIAVNIPEFQLHVYNGDSLLWSCNVVVGQKVHPTTVFYGQIKYIVFSPYWNIPESIVRAEVLPGIKKDKDYMIKHHMEITGSSNGIPMIRQKPGADNSLGLVKFLFPNSYNIYLHDTPSKSLFNESSRVFSHGCIRIEAPAKLANFLLKDYKQWNRIKIDSAMKSGTQHLVTLKDKVPVFIAYFTAFIDRDNRLNFRKDIYHLDERLADMIISGNGVYDKE